MELAVRGIPVYYESIGAGTPVVMVHGWSPDHRLMSGCMEPIITSIDRPYRRIYFDLPGMGRTPAADWITCSDDLLEVVLGVIDALVPEGEFLLAGESYGGYLARGVLAKRPGRVAGLALICPHARVQVKTEAGVDRGEVPPLRVLQADPELVEGMGEMERRAFVGLTVQQNQRVLDRFREEIFAGLKLADVGFLTRVPAGFSAFSFPVDGELPPYDRPTLMVTGRQDSVTGYRELYKLIESYPRATYAVLDKAGHNLQIEQDVLLSALVREWLDRVAAEPQG